MPFYTLSVCLKLPIFVTPVTEQPGCHSLLVKIPNSNNGNKNWHRNPLLVIHCHSYKKLVVGPWISLPFGCFLDLSIRGGQFETILFCVPHICCERHMRECGGGKSWSLDEMYTWNKRDVCLKFGQDERDWHGNPGTSLQWNLPSRLSSLLSAKMRRQHAWMLACDMLKKREDLSGKWKACFNETNTEDIRGNKKSCWQYV